MNCSDVVANFTDYLDGCASDESSAAIEEHLRACPSCVRYRNVLVHGADLLRALPEPELREDFEPRLRHRLYHVEDERALGSHAASGTPALTVLGIAILLTAVAWSPTLVGSSPVVELEAIVVDRAPARAPTRPVSVTPPGTFSTKGETALDESLWANTLLYDYSAINQRYEQRARAMARRSRLLDR